MQFRSSLTDLQRDVAEPIMCWTVGRIRKAPLYGLPLHSAGAEHGLDEVPAYTGNLLDAWSVFEEMHRGDSSYEVSISSALRSLTARIAKEKLCTFDYHSRTVPEAICRSALEVIRWRGQSWRGRAVGINRYRAGNFQLLPAGSKRQRYFQQRRKYHRLSNQV